SPDGTLLRVTTVQKPFSYTVPASSFGSVEELWDATGRVVYRIAERPLREGQVDRDDDDTAAADTARRNLTWAPDGRGLVYLQMAPRPAGAAARDTAAAADSAGGRGGRAPARRDRLVQWSAPFDAS